MNRLERRVTSDSSLGASQILIAWPKSWRYGGVLLPLTFDFHGDN